MDESAGLPVNSVQSSPVEFVVVGNRQSLFSATRKDSTKLDVTASLAEKMKSELRKNHEHLLCGQDS